MVPLQPVMAEYLINALWQLPLLAAGAWFLLRMVKAGPQVQYWVWVGVLAVAVLLPARGLGGLEPRSTMQPVTLPAPIGYPGKGDNSPRGNQQIKSAPFGRLLTLLPVAQRVPVSASTVQWIARFYLATVVFAMIRLAQSGRAAWLLSRRAHPCCTHQAALAYYSSRFKMKPPLARVSSEIGGPMIAGIRSPVLLLPANFGALGEEQVGAALCHELAHLQRRDPLLNLACQLATLPLAWHPVTYWLQQRIRMTREMACDARAAKEMASELEYAKCLLALAHTVLGARTLAMQNHFIGLFGSNTLEERIMQLTEKTTRSMSAKVARLAIGTAMMVASCVVAATLHLAPMQASSILQSSPQATVPTVAQSQQEPAPAAVVPPVAPPQTTRHYSELNSQEKARVQQQIAAARLQAASAAALVKSQAFKKQFEDAERQARHAAAMMNSDEFRKQMEDARRQAAKASELMNSAEFKQRMEDAQRQALRAQAMVDSPEFKKQVEDAIEQAKQGQTVLEREDIKRELEDAQRHAADVARQMMDIDKQISEAMKDFHLEDPAPQP